MGFGAGVARASFDRLRMSGCRICFPSPAHAELVEAQAQNYPVTSATAAINCSMFPEVSPATLIRPDPAK
jgi:hypothetical protein